MPICATFLLLKINPPLSNGPPAASKRSYSQYHPRHCPAMSVKVTKMALWLTLLHAFVYPFPINPAHGSQENHSIQLPTALKRIHCKIKAITQRKPFISYVIPLPLLHVHTSIKHKSHPQAYTHTGIFQTLLQSVGSFCLSMGSITQTLLSGYVRYSFLLVVTWIRNIPHRPMYKNLWYLAFGTISGGCGTLRRRSHVGGSISLGVGFDS